MAQRAFRTLDKSVRRQRIVDTAVELFHRKGYRATTLDDLAQELGITKAALYHYVESKEELLFIIYTQALQSIFKETYRIAAMDFPPDEKLRRIIQNHIVNIIVREQPLFFVFFTEENQLPEKYYGMVREKKKEYDRILREIIQEGINRGLFHEDDPRLLGYAIVGMCNWLYKWYRPDGPDSPDEIADQFIRILERGYLRSDESGSVAIPPRQKPFTSEIPRDDVALTLKRLKERCREMMELLDALERKR